MSQIQITNEISERLMSLQSAISASTNFSQASQLFFENTQFPSLTGYQNIIQSVGRLGARYRVIFERDIKACEQIVENNRILDQQIGKAMKASI